MDNLHTVDFSVTTSGSKLFDLTLYHDAHQFCARYPGLDCEYRDNTIHVFGELNDYWWDKYNRDQLEIVNFLK